MYHSFSRLSTLNNAVSLRQTGGHLTICLRDLRLQRFPLLACFKLSDSGEDAKVKGTRPPLPNFSCSRFVYTADPTISEPRTGYSTFCKRCMCFSSRHQMQSRGDGEAL